MERHGKASTGQFWLWLSAASTDWQLGCLWPTCMQRCDQTDSSVKKKKKKKREGRELLKNPTHPLPMLPKMGAFSCHWQAARNVWLLLLHLAASGMWQHIQTPPPLPPPLPPPPPPPPPSHWLTGLMHGGVGPCDIQFPIAVHRAHVAWHAVAAWASRSHWHPRCCALYHHVV